MPFHVNHRTMPTREPRPSIRVVRAVAAYTDTDPLELQPLQEAIDAEALDALFAPTDRRQLPGPGRVQFVYEGHEVTVFSDGTVDVSESPATGTEQGARPPEIGQGEPRSEADAR